MSNWYRLCAAALLVVLTPTIVSAQHSVARQWNEALLGAIRSDFARPTVHARNLFHTSIAMYDAWTAYDDVADLYLLGRTVGGFTCTFTGLPTPADVTAAREEAISYAMYRLLSHRFANSPGAETSLASFDSLLSTLGYDADTTSTDYTTGSPAALGNYIAQCLIDFGFQDGSNEQGEYKNLFYVPFNPTLIPIIPGNPDIIDPNRWQPLTLDVYIDQSGNILPDSTPDFLSPEWGIVSAFALAGDHLTIYPRDGFNYWVYHDPGAPPHLDTLAVGGMSDEYKWGFELVSIWGSHLDPADGVMMDISPGAIGNGPPLPQTIADYRNYYNLFDGGDPGTGHPVNPHTGQPYAPEIVPRADYTRVLAEFWADGPDSETPPGHWFTILNYVNDHPLFEKRFRGQGPILDDLEWDVKAYFAMAGAVHDAAVASWGIKGWYDYLRPISAIRCMADRGQSSDSNLPNYDPGGITLIPGYIEQVQMGDTLAGDSLQHIDKIKLYTWRGPDYIEEPETDVAGVGWILAENWWPYQRPTFVTPPFAGYISGHSTFSRAAAVVMTLLTGDEFFPGGLGEFLAPMNEFLVFEDGPSVDVTLQWATYRDASDQTSLSRIWGGIHPPADDIPGRFIGETIGAEAFSWAERYFDGTISPVFVTAFDAGPVDNGIALAWSIFADEGFDGFLIVRSRRGEAKEDVITPQILDPSERAYIDTSARPGEQYRYTLVIVGTATGDIRSAAISVESPMLAMHLSQNHPNPFNPVTTIQYTVPSKAHATLRIYSTTGQLVRTLVDAQSPPGTHDVTWDGKNDAGNAVASGIYVYRLRAGRSIQSRKMTLLK